ncbi:response regulator transcription factor [Dongia soli]|uniref:Response regulator transcription factor n=1 Tax=Dongia soli TaxID=600628 RepID=A0ABU5E6T9_9PROT|nr:response regulator transcription factor [Dongia soli]MDY0881586.1 response regulator transcription factor [Dongia soli]
MSNETRILIVDDEPAIRRFLRSSLIAAGFAVEQAETGADALTLNRQMKPDLVILDLGLPDLDGLDVIRQLRATSSVPIIVLSVRNDESGKVVALDNGADDYVTKPFGVEEMLARIRAALRHRLQEQGHGPVFQNGDLSIDFLQRSVKLRGNELRLSRREYDLLRFLAEHAGKVITHQQLLTAVWGEAHRNDVEYLRVYVRQLRQKLEDDPQQPAYLQTEPGVGYRLRLLEPTAS